MFLEPVLLAAAVPSDTFAGAFLLVVVDSFVTVAGTIGIGFLVDSPLLLVDDNCSAANS